jgi:hypothetical protein
MSVSTSALSLYLTYAPNETADAAAQARASPAVQNLMTYFQKTAPSFTSADQLLKDPRALSVVLGAFGLSAYQQDTALLRQLMTQDPTKAGSLAYRMGSSQIQAFAEALSNWSSPPFAKASSVNAIIQSYTAAQFEQNAGANSPGLSNALYFTRNIASVGGLTGLAGDSTLLQVAIAALNISYDDFANLGFDQQTSLLNAKITPADLSNPAWIKKTAEQYLLAQQVLAGPAQAAALPGSVASLFSTNAASSGDNALLTILSTAQNGSLASTSGASNPLLSLFV